MATATFDPRSSRAWRRGRSDDRARGLLTNQSRPERVRSSEEEPLAPKGVCVLLNGAPGLREPAGFQVLLLLWDGELLSEDWLPGNRVITAH